MKKSQDEPLTPEQRELVARNVGLAHVAGRDFERFYASLEADEVLSCCLLALCVAVRTWQPERGTLSTHHRWVCRPALNEAIFHAPTFGRPRTLRRDGVQRQPMFHLDDQIDGRRSAEAVLSDADDVAAAMETLGERESRLLDRIFWGGLSLKDAGREIGLSKARVSRLYHESLRRMRRHLEARQR